MTDRIAGLSIQARPHHALVVLVREDGVWRVESATTEVGDVTAIANPGCPVIVNAAAFWQHSEQRRMSAPDAEQLLAAGWDVRGPVMKGDKPKNPERGVMEGHLGEMEEAGRLLPSEPGSDAAYEALLLAAWGTRDAAKIDEAAVRRAKAIAAVIDPPDPLAHLLPHQRLVANALTAWLATDTPIAIVIGDRRSGKAYTVNAWAKATGLRFEAVQPSYANSEEGLDDCKQGPRDLTVFFEAEKIPRQMVVDALHAGRVVLVVGALPPDSAAGQWPRDLVAAILAGNAAGVVIECNAPPREVPPAVMKLVAVIDPAGAA